MSDSKVSTEIEKPEYPSWKTYTIVPVFQQGPVGSPEGNPGKYSVSFVLSTLNVFISNDITFSDPESGSSYILARNPQDNSKDAIQKIKIQTTNQIGEELTYILGTNISGILNQLTVEVEAKSFTNATRIAYKRIAPYLSKLAFEHDTPVLFNRIELLETNTGSLRIFVLSEGKTKPINTMSTEIAPEASNLLALYREALNSAFTPLYQLFCFYKIIDGYYATRSHIARQGKIISLDETIPTGYIHEGKKFNFVKNWVRNNFRNSFAHFNMDESNTMIQSPDDMDYINEAINIIPELKYIAQKMINSLL